MFFGRSEFLQYGEGEHWEEAAEEGGSVESSETIPNVSEMNRDSSVNGEEFADKKQRVVFLLVAGGYKRRAVYGQAAEKHFSCVLSIDV